MGYASKQGRARVSARNPSAAAVCDRCGFVYQHNKLRWQMDWGGAALINRRMLVCDTCYDTPQQQLRSIVIPADPVPIQNPRVPSYYTAEIDYRTTQGNTIDPVTGLPVIGGDTRGSYTTPEANSQYILLQENGVFALELEGGGGYLAEEQTIVTPAEVYERVTQQTGEAPGGLNQQPGTDTNAPGDDDPGLPYENVVIPETGPL